MKIESERIKKKLKEVSQKEGSTKTYGLLCEILENVQRHENKLADDRADDVKNIIDKELEEV